MRKWIDKIFFPALLFSFLSLFYLSFINPLSGTEKAEDRQDREEKQETAHSPKAQQKQLYNGWLGVRIADLGSFIRTPALNHDFRSIIELYLESGELPLGIVILETVKGSPAEAYGLLPGYIIKRAQRINIDNAFTFSFIISRIEPGEFIELEVWDSRGNYNVYIKVGERPVNMPRPPESAYFQRLEQEKSQNNINRKGQAN